MSLQWSKLRKAQKIKRIGEGSSDVVTSDASNRKKRYLCIHLSICICQVGNLTREGTDKAAAVILCHSHPWRRPSVITVREKKHVL